MTKLREYLVALDVRSTLHAWIAATSEDDALRKAEDLYCEDDGVFTAKGGSIETVTVLDSRAVTGTPERIAADILGIPTLKSRGSDELDIHAVSVWQLEAALARAYAAGRQAAAGGAQ